MIKEAEKFKEQDQEIKVAIASKNELETYLYQMKNLMTDPNVSQKVGESNATKILKKCEEIIQWLSATEHASEKEYVMRKQELETLCRPIVVSLYSAPDQRNPGGGRQFPNAPSNGGSGGTGPTIEEVD